jgi:hypothetical protein
MITIPAFMVGANSGKIDQIIKDGTNASNDFIYEEFRTDLDEFDAQTRQREGLLASLNAQLLDGGGSISLTPAEEQRQNDLRAQIATLEGDIRDLEGDRSRFDSARTDAQTRMDDEFEGTRGATAGQGPRWRDAKADFDEAERNVTRINSEIAGKRSDMNSIRGEITAIDQSAGARANRERDVANAQSTAIQVQIAGLQAELAQRASDRQDISDVDALAAAHPEFVDPDPDIAEQFSTYVGYLTSEESTTADWLPNIGLLLMLSLLEAGVFLLAAARPVSEGEKNAYRGAVAIDRVQKLHEEFEKVKDKIDKEKLGIEAAKWAAGKEAIEDSIARVKAMEAEKREQMIQFMRDNPEHTNQILQQILHTMAEMQGAENVTDMAENPVYKAFLEAQQETISEAYITEAQDPRVTAFYDALDASTGERPIQIAERSRAVTSLGSSPPRLRTLK